MKLKFNNKYLKWGLTAFLVRAAAIIFYYFMFHNSNIRASFRMIINILMPIVWGLAIAYLLSPILNFVENKLLLPVCKKLKIKESPKRNSVVRGIGILATAFLFVELIYGLFYMLISEIVPSVESIISNFDSYTNNFIQWINKTLEDNPEFSAYVIKTVNNYSDELEKWLEALVPNTVGLIKTVSISVLNILGVLWDFVIGFIISIYVLASKEKFAGYAKKIAYALFERGTANTIIKNFRFTHKTFSGFLGGKIIDSIIIGILCLICTSIMKLPYAVLVSVIIGVTNVIPFFGPFLGAIPCTILIFIVDPMHPLNCVYFVIFILILQQFDGNILGPKILGNSTGLAGFWVIFAITLFGGLWGVFGMIVGVPIWAIIFAGIKSFINSRLEKKQLPYEIEKYENLDYVDEDGLHDCELPEKKQRKNPLSCIMKKSSSMKKRFSEKKDVLMKKSSSEDNNPSKKN